MRLFKDKKSVTINKEHFVEAWLRSGYTTGISPIESARQLRVFEKLLGLSFADVMDAVCARMSVADLDSDIGEK